MKPRSESPPILPPLLPPPLPTNDDSQLRWLIMAGAMIGILLGLVLMGLFLVHPSGQNSSSNGAGAAIALNLAGSGSDTESQAGNKFGEKDAQQDLLAQSTDAADANKMPSVEATTSEKVDVPHMETGSESSTSANANGKAPEEPPRAFALDVYEKPLNPAVRGRAASGTATARVNLESGPNPFTGDGNWTSAVFVIDRSSSMQGRDRFPRVVAALRRALEVMKNDQSFTVILFDTVANPFDSSKGLMKANSTNKRIVSEWLDATQPNGGTDPSEAILLAIELHAQRIVVLSDGEFDPLVVEMVTAANQSQRKSCQIDCVGLQEMVHTLQDLAHQNKGSYYQAQ